MDLTYEEYVSYGGTAKELTFPNLEAKASAVLHVLTRNAFLDNDISQFTTRQVEAFKRAIASQVDYYSVQGVNTSAAQGTTQAITIGRTTQAFSNNASNTSSVDGISKEVFFWLNSAGLMYSGVSTHGYCTSAHVVATFG